MKQKRFKKKILSVGLLTIMLLVDAIVIGAAILNAPTVGSNGSNGINDLSGGNEEKSLANTPWPMFLGNLQHTGQSPYSTVWDDGTLKWEFYTGGSPESSPVIGIDGTIYIGSDDGYGDNYTYAINPDGTLKWRFPTGGWVRSTPAIGSNGTIYVGCDDHYLYAINPDGTLKWKFDTGYPVESSPAIGSDGTIYVGASSLTDGYLYAINPDGTLKWKFHTGFLVSLSSPAIGSDGTIYIGGNLNPSNYSDYLYAINPDGTLKWEYPIGGDIVDTSPVIGSDGTIYVATEEGNFYAISSDGSYEWSYYFGDYIASAPAIGSDGTIYVALLDNYTYALYPDGSLDPNGAVKWKCYTGANWGSPAIGSNGTIYVGSADGYLYAIDPNGTLKWKFQTGGPIDCSPAINWDGTIYISSDDGYVYAIGSSLSPPQNLEAIAGNGYVNLTWAPPSAGEAVSEYKIYRGTQSEQESYLATVAGNITHYQDTSVINGVTYYYYVTAVNASGESPPSNEISATPENIEFQIYSKLSGYFLENVTPIQNTFGAYIKWSGAEPEKVWAIINGHNYSVYNYTGGKWNLTVDMGKIGFANNITFYAEFSNGSIISASKEIEMLHTPWWLSKLLSACAWVTHIITNTTWKNTWELEIHFPPTNYNGEFKFTGVADLPFIGGAYGVKTPYSFKLTYKSTGSIEIEGEAKLSGADVDLGVADARENFTLSATGNFNIENSTIVWKSAELDVKIEGDIVAFYPLLGYEFKFAGHDITIGVVARFEIKPEIAVGLLFMPTLNASQELIPGTGIMLEGINGTIKIPFTLAIDAGMAIGKITGGGTLEFDMGVLLNKTFKPVVDWFKIIGKIFVRLDALFFNYTIWQKEGTLYSWNNTNIESSGAGGISMIYSNDERKSFKVSGDGWNLTFRYYNTTDYNKLVWDTDSEMGKVINDIYPRTDVSVAGSGDKDIMFYTYDDVNETERHGLKIKAYMYDHSTNKWTEITPPPIGEEIAYKPVCKMLDNERMLVLWSTIPYSVVDNITTPENITETNLRMGIYDIANDSWENVTTLMSDGVCVDYGVINATHILVLKADNILGIQSSVLIVDIRDGKVTEEIADAGDYAKIVAIDGDMAILKSLEGNYTVLIWENGMKLVNIPELDNYTLISVGVNGSEIYGLYSSVNGTDNELIGYVFNGSGFTEKDRYLMAGDSGEIHVFTVNNITLASYLNKTSIIIGRLENGTISIMKNLTIENVTEYGLVIHSHTLRIWYLYVTGGNISEPIKSLGFAVIETTPTAPLNVTAVAGNGYVNLTFSVPEDEGLYPITGYNIYRNGVLIATVPVTQLWYNDTNVVSGQTYTYYVTAVNTLGESAPSVSINATPNGTVPEFSETLPLLLMIGGAIIVMLPPKKRNRNNKV